MQEPLIRVGKVCRDEGAGEFCMRGTYATRDIKVRDCPFDRYLTTSHIQHRNVPIAVFPCQKKALPTTQHGLALGLSRAEHFPDA